MSSIGGGGGSRFQYDKLNPLAILGPGSESEESTSVSPSDDNETINPLHAASEIPDAASSIDESLVELSSSADSVLQATKKSSTWLKRVSFVLPKEGKLTEAVTETALKALPEVVSSPLIEAGSIIPVLGAVFSSINLCLLSTDLKRIVQQCKKNVALNEKIEKRIRKLRNIHNELIIEYQKTGGSSIIGDRLLEVDREISTLKDTQGQILYSLNQNATRIKRDIVRVVGGAAVVGGTATLKVAGLGVILLGLGTAINIGSNIDRAGRSLGKRILRIKGVERNKKATQAYMNYREVCISAVKKAKSSPLSQIARIAEDHGMTKEELKKMMQVEIPKGEDTSNLIDLSPEVCRVRRDFIANLEIDSSPVKFMDVKEQKKIVKNIMARMASTMKFK